MRMRCNIGSCEVNSDILQLGEERGRDTAKHKVTDDAEGTSAILST
jgi:hypothetical protein